MRELADSYDRSIATMRRPTRAAYASSSSTAQKIDTLLVIPL
ncbi:MAG: hypothetical protein WBX30_12590 [Stellaceae bacterium]